MRLALRLGAPLVSFAAVYACSGDPSSPSQVSIQPTILVPRGLLDPVTQLTVTVFDQTNGVDCDPATHKVTGNAPANPTSIDLKKSGCAPPAKWCGDLAIARSDTPRVFAAVAKTDVAEVADGCVVAVANQDRLALTIPMSRFVPPSVCGDGTVGATEQCEPPGAAGDQVCDANCHTIEEYLSAGGGGQTVDGAPGKKTTPSFVWPSASGQTGRFLAAFGDATKSNPQIALRILGDALSNDSTLGGAATFSFFFPDTSGSFPPPPEPGNHGNPATSIAAGKFVVVFQDDSLGTVDIALRTIPVANPTTGDQGNGQSIPINGDGTHTESGVQFNPTVAAGQGGNVFVAWQSAPAIGSGQIFGRAYNLSNGTRTAQIEISTGTSNQNVRLAPTPNGWVAVWQDGSDIKVRLINGDGSVSSPEQVVNDGSHHGAQDHPSVATLADGRFAVAWADHGASGGTDIFVQRYAADGTLVPQDQAVPINNVNGQGEQVTPVIAAGSAAGGMYVVTWVDQASNHVRARLLGGSGGFLFNNVDGQTNEFQASLVDGHARANPTVAVGGSGPFIAIGWEDLDPSKPGIYVRRFPAPTQ